MKIVLILDRVIEYSFYLLFLSAPLVFSGSTSELFELNKMWLTFALTCIITASWLGKMVAERRFYLRATALDLPIILFLCPLLLSTLFSIDRHVSLWGYYSRFNGGLFSIISYILLYYAFVSNLARDSKSPAKRVLLVSLFSAAVVSVWGVASHFGYDLTCFIFRGDIKAACWTEDFRPTIRIFSTLGQPNWLAAYMAILIPIALAFGIINPKSKILNPKQSHNPNSKNLRLFEFRKFGNWNLFSICGLVLSALFFLALLYTRSQSGILGAFCALAVFSGLYIYTLIRRTKNKTHKSFLKTTSFLPLIGMGLVFLLLIFLAGFPINKIHKYTLPSILSSSRQTATQTPPATASLDANITSSGKIRMIVWQGALSIWRENPLLGTGVETFAFSYYKHRPVEHNLTSEWNFIYNKAHNEYLNYLATTGTLGFLTYLLLIGSFLYIAAKYLLRADFSGRWLLSASLISAYASILVTNFFGFSVVVVNLYFYLIPALFFSISGVGLGREISYPARKVKDNSPSPAFNLLFIPIVFAAAFVLLLLARTRQADIDYSMGTQLNNAGEYQNAYIYLSDASSSWPSEPIYKSELSVSAGALSTQYILALKQQEATASSEADKEAEAFARKLEDQALHLIDDVVSDYPHNVLFLKTKVRLLRAMSQADKKHLTDALDAAEKAQALAPTDPSNFYNKGLILSEMGEKEDAIKSMEKAVNLKPDYKDARLGLALLYREKSQESSDEAESRVFAQKAVDQLNYILEHISPDDTQVKDLLDSWQK